jgi:pyruvate formate lyase activating enzyme
MPEPTGRLFEIQRFSIHDGPGIRTTVFFQGCPLRCLWCHNPEGRATGPLLSFQEDRCVGCGHCFRACPQHAHGMEDGQRVLARDECVVCGLCAAGCPARALELIGREFTIDEVLDEALPDRPFYETSGGGLTLSGGEPLYQIDFAVRLLEAAGQAGLHCAVETCGFVPFPHLERVLPRVDLFLYDIKETDANRHVEYTGVAHRRILDNLRRLHARGARIRLRLPVIPGHNDRPDHFAEAAGLVRSLPSLEGVELMPYHRLGTSKLSRLGLGKGPDVEPPASATVDAWIDQFARLGVRLLNRKQSDLLSSRKSTAHADIR